MPLITDNVLYIGGLITAGIALAVIIICIIFSHIIALKLKFKFNSEYGERKKRK